MGNYIPSSRPEREAMLRTIGLASFADLYRDVPESVRIDRLDMPSGLSQMEAEQRMAAMAARNRPFSTVLRGAGSYDHYIPSVVDSVTGKEEFVTTYTPYQAEISQGVLQSIFEFQTMVCELTGMDISNASLYDGASAAAEAAMMCQARKKTRVYAFDNAHPDTLATIKTYCWGRGIPFELLPAKDGLADAAALDGLKEDAACVYLQQPNFFGLIEDAAAVAGAAHAKGAKFIMGVHPISLGLLATPNECGADIAVGEGQPLGIPMSFGGPYLGFIAVRKELARSLPGRIVGQTADSRGQRAFVLTLQAREQHIRREKASSNICSNQALCAMRAAVYMAAMGPGGIRQAAQNCCDKAHYFMNALCALPGFRRVHEGEFFNEFVTTLPMDAQRVEKILMQHDILAGLPVENGMLWCVTEKVSKARLDEAVQALRGGYSK